MIPARRVVTLALTLALLVSGFVCPPASAEYGLIYIPDSVYDFNLPEIPDTGEGVMELDFDPFLAGVDGFRAWMYWDSVIIQSECDRLLIDAGLVDEDYASMELTYASAVQAIYPEGNYIREVIALFRNDAMKSLISYHILYETAENEFYLISYFGVRYREQMKGYVPVDQATVDEGRPDDPEAREQFYDDLAAEERFFVRVCPDPENHPTYYQYQPATAEELEDLTRTIRKYKLDPNLWYTPSPDTIYRGIYRGQGYVLQNGSGRYLGSAVWVYWDDELQEMVFSDLEGLRRLYSFPSPRYKTLYDEEDEDTIG